jgi:predicted nucleotidyltransferase
MIAVDVTKLILANERREAERAAARELRARRARAAAERVAARIAAELDPIRVTLFGSLARGRFLEHSDIDLAIAGLTAAELDEARRIALEEPEFRVEVVPFERAHDFIRAAVERDGIVLWSRA